MINELTTTAAVAIAKRHLSYGHYAAGEATIYVNCPTCNERVDRAWNALDNFRPNTAGHSNALRVALVVHLTEGWCES